MKLTCRTIFLALLAFAAFFSASCTKAKSIDLGLSSSDGITPDLRWAVVKVPLAAVRSGYSYDRNVLFHVRNGEIYLVQGMRAEKIIYADDINEDSKFRKKRVDEYMTWYKIESGWVDRNQVDVYDTRLKAETASKRLLATGKK